MISTRGYATHGPQSPLRAFAFEREEPRERDVQIQVLFCGVCHSDIHQAKNEWSNTVYPCVPGHEVVGRVTKIGAGVTTHAVGDIVGVGCMIDSCRHCKPCKLGAEAVLDSDAKALAQHASSFDFMLSTVPQRHDLNPYLPMLKRDCTLVVVGALEVMAPVNNQQVAFHRRSVSGSLIGSIAETQEVIDLCARHGIGPDIEMLRIQDLNEAYARIEQGEVRFRYVIDMASLAEEPVPIT